MKHTKTELFWVDWLSKYGSSHVSRLPTYKLKRIDVRKMLSRALIEYDNGIVHLSGYGRSVNLERESKLSAASVAGTPAR
jgi:hypothetical protein